MSNRTDIQIVIAGRYEGHSAFQAASNDMQAMLAQVRESRQRLSPFGQLVANAERQQAGRDTAAAEQQRRQSAMMAELAEARVAGERQWRQTEQEALKASLTAQWEASQQKVAMATREYRQRVELEDRYFALTHSRREVELASIQSYYARLRAQHAGNARMMAMIDKTYAAEVAQLNAGGGQGGRAGGGWLGALGGKGLVRKELKYAAANLASMEGGEVGMMISAMLTMSGLAAGVAAGVILIGGAYRTASSHARDLVEVQRRGHDMVKADQDWMRRLTEPQGTALGGQLLARAQEFEQKAADIEKVGRDRIKDLSLREALWIAMEGSVKGGRENTRFGQMVLEEIRQADWALKRAVESRKQYNAELEIGHRLMLGNLEYARQMGQIEAMADSSQRRRLELETRQADRRRRMWAEIEEQARAADLDKSDGAAERRARLARDFDARVATQAELDLAEQTRLERTLANEAAASRRDIQMARIAVDRQGYDRQRAELDAQLAYERDVYAGNQEKLTEITELYALRRRGIDAAEADERARRLADLTDQARRAEIDVLLRGPAAQLAQINIDNQRALKESQDPELQQRINNARVARWQRDQADREKALAADVAEARARLMNDQHAREMELLRIRHQRETEAAAGWTLAQRRLLAERQALELQAAGRGGRAIQVAALDRGLLTRAPGYADPAADAARAQRDVARNTDRANGLLGGVVAAINTLAERLGLAQIARF